MPSGSCAVAIDGTAYAVAFFQTQRDAGSGLESRKARHRRTEYRSSCTMSDHAQTNGSTLNKFLNTVEVARLLKLKPKTLENMRWKGYARDLRHGANAADQRDDVMRWSEARAVSQPAGHCIKRPTAGRYQVGPPA